MTDFSKLSPLHPDRVRETLRVIDGDMIAWERETCREALKVVSKLQTGFGYAPDLYNQVETAKTFGSQASAAFKFVKGLISQK